MENEVVVKYIKRKNKIRKIVTYSEFSELKKYHKAVVDFLRGNAYTSLFAKAYVPGTSIYKNAEAHLYNDIFIKTDIKQFFSSINLKILEEQLFKEVNKRSEISRHECHEIVEKCSLGRRGLPLGLVSSPELANIYLKEFDGILYGKLKKMNLKNPIYTRYADDLTISFKGKATESYDDVIESILTLINFVLNKYKLKLNVNKTQIINLYTSNHVRITGISIIKHKDNVRHISVGRKTKNLLFWDAVSLYDSNKQNYPELLRLKGVLSFALSIEKTGIEDIYSAHMIQMLHDRGCENIKGLLNEIEKKYK